MAPLHWRGVCDCHRFHIAFSSPIQVLRTPQHLYKFTFPRKLESEFWLIRIRELLTVNDKWGGTANKSLITFLILQSTSNWKCYTRLKCWMKKRQNMSSIYKYIYKYTHNANWQPTNKILGNDSLNQTWHQRWRGLLSHISTLLNSLCIALFNSLFSLPLNIPAD